MNILFVYDKEIIPHSGGVERVTLVLSEELKKRGHGIVFLSLGNSSRKSVDSQYKFPQYSLSLKEPDFFSSFLDLLETHAIGRVIFQNMSNDTMSLLRHPGFPENVKKAVVLHNRPNAYYGHERYIMGLTPWRDLSVTEKILKGLAYVSPHLFRYVRKVKNGDRYRQATRFSDYFVLLSSRYIPLVQKLTGDTESSNVVSVNNPNTFPLTGIGDVTASKEKIVLFVGRLNNTQKNVSGFIDVWKEFSEKHPDWKGLIVGEGEHRDIIERYAGKKGVKNLFFEGNRENITDYYKKAPVLCMTSCYEGWPMVLTEAMAYGCIPVVYDSFEAVHDLIEDGRNGFVIKAFDRAKMVAALSGLADDGELRKKMAAEGEEKIKEFSVENIVDRWESLLMHPRSVQ